MREMKDSGIAWIGVIPQDWEIVRTKSLYCSAKEIAGDRADDFERLALTLNGVIKRSKEDSVGLQPEKFSGYQILKKGELVFKLIDLENVATSRVGLSPYTGIVSPAYIVLSKQSRAKDLVVRYSMYHFLSMWQREIFNQMGDNGVRSSLNAKELLNIPHPFPSIYEQKRIVTFLDAQCAEIDAVLEKTRASIEEYKKLKQAVITQAVTKGIRGDRPMKDSGIEWIGEIPAEWTASKIKYCTEFAPSCNTSHLSEDSLVTFTPMECIKNGYFENREAHFSALSSSYTQYQDGDIVFAKVTPCFENGNIAIMQGLSAGVGFGSSELFVIRPQSINTEFIFYYLQNDIFKQYACATMTGTGGLKRVSPTFVRNYSVFIPCNEEQLEIVRYLNEKCSGIEVLIAKKQQYLTEIENYKKSLIYEYVTGKKEVHPL